MGPKIIDVSKIKSFPSNTEIPAYNPSYSLRSLTTGFLENDGPLDQVEAIKVITDISEDLNNIWEKPTNIPKHIHELQAVFDFSKVKELDSDLFKEGKYTVIMDDYF